jgi:hypothetical protein
MSTAPCVFARQCSAEGELQADMHGAAETRCILLGSALDLSWYLLPSPPLLSNGSEREVTAEPQPERARKQWAVGMGSGHGQWAPGVPRQCFLKVPNQGASASKCKCKCKPKCKPTAPSKVPTRARITLQESRT